MTRLLLTSHGIYYFTSHVFLGSKLQFESETGTKMGWLFFPVLLILYGFKNLCCECAGSFCRLLALVIKNVLK